MLLARIGLALVTLAFLAGLTLVVAGAAPTALPLFTAGCVLLVTLPVVSVVTALAEELRRDEWLFASAAALVLVLLLFAVLVRLA